MINTLFTSAGRRVELLRSFHNAYKKLGLQGNIIAVDIDPIAPALKVADRHYIVPRLSNPNYLPALVHICQNEAIDQIFPLIDPDILFLSNHRQKLEATGARLVVVPSNAAMMTNDKWATTQFFQSLDLPVPRSWRPNDLYSATIEYPLFIKPRGGSGAKHTYKVHNFQELSFFLNYVPDPIIQEYLPGPEITCDVICDLDSELLGVVLRRRLEVRWGEVAKGVTVHDPYIIDACVKIAKALPATGPITIQCILKNDVPYFTEINARFGGGVPLGIAAGVDGPCWLLARAADIPIEIPPLGSYQTGLYMTRFDDSFFLSEQAREEMASRRL